MKNLKDYIIEASHNIKHDKKNMVFSTNGGELTYFDIPVTTGVDYDAIEIQTLHVTNRRKGIGSALVNAIKDYAKKIDKPIVLYAAPMDSEMTEQQLIKFYTNLGFEEVSGKILRYEHK